MRVFKVPFDIKREEKIFGGYLSLRQVLYLMLCASSLVLLATHMPIFIKIILITIFSVFFLLCCFLKIVLSLNSPPYSLNKSTKCAIIIITIPNSY